MTDQDKQCVKCGAPRAKGFVGLVTDRCLSCARDHLGVESTANHSEQAAPAKNLEVPQPEVEKAIEIEQDIEVEQASSVDEGEQSSNSRKWRTQLSAAKSADGKKLTPACTNCKKSKIRCVHRQVIEIDDNDAPPRKRRREVKAHADDKDEAGNGDGILTGLGTERPLRIPLKGRHEEVVMQPASSPHESGQTQGGVRKRKSDEVEDETPSGGVKSKTAAAMGDDGTGTREASNPPRKRGRRGRKPKVERVGEAIEQVAFRGATPATAAATAVTTSPAAASGARSLPSFPRGNLEGAAYLSVHTVLSRELQQKLGDAEIKWRAAIQSLQAAKQALDSWVEVWNRGL